jgi:hypothetical protein
MAELSGESLRPYRCGEKALGKAGIGVAKEFVMNAVPYTYSVIKYVHDPAAGEMLNIGVVLVATAVPYAAAKIEYRYERLSEAFVNFDGENYKRALRQFEQAVADFQGRLKAGLLPMLTHPSDVEALGRMIWPDSDLSFRLGPMLAGVTDNPEEAIEILFDRMVASQYQRESRERRSDEQVWATYQTSLQKERVSRVLQPKTFIAEGFELKFEHSFKNERWHILEPVSLDYAKVEGIRNKVSRLLGDATALQDHPELGKLYVLLGPPRLKEHREDYDRAKKLLHKMPIEHELVEEGYAENFARDLAKYLRQHGVIEDARDK